MFLVCVVSSRIADACSKEQLACMLWEYKNNRMKLRGGDEMVIGTDQLGTST
jgi:hypothetical protein